VRGRQRHLAAALTVELRQDLVDREQLVVACSSGSGSF
jgi:hypothetical protein